MCLTIEKNSKGKIAKSDIVCYKLVESFNGKLQTIYRGSPIEIGSTYESEIILWNEVFIDVALHSITNLSDCKRLKTVEKIFSPKAIIVKCIIPKGSKYYRGLFGTENNFNSYACDKLTYVEVLSKTKSKE